MKKMLAFALLCALLSGAAAAETGAGYCLPSMALNQGNGLLRRSFRPPRNDRKPRSLREGLIYRADVAIRFPYLLFRR